MTKQLDAAPQDVPEPLLILLSGDRADDLMANRTELSHQIAEGPPEEFGGIVARWNQERAGHGKWRAAVVAETSEAAIERLESVVAHEARNRAVAVLFPGQGSQHVRMAAGLYDWDPVFTAAMDGYFDVTRRVTDVANAELLRADWLSAEPRVSIHDVSRSQPLLVGVEYAMARCLIEWGVEPDALLGHSAGEVVASVVAGVFTLDAAVSLMAHRARAARKQPPGGMLGVAASAQRLVPFLTGQVTIAAVNSPRQTVLAGPDTELAAVAQTLTDHGFQVVTVPSTLGFHSPAMEGLARSSLDVLAGVRLREPDTALYSAYTCDRLHRDKALDPWFWARQIVEPVLFWPTLNRLLADGDFLLVETGPGQGLATAARRHRSVVTGSSAVVAMQPTGPGDPLGDRRAFCRAAGRLWSEGHNLTAAAWSSREMRTNWPCPPGAPTTASTQLAPRQPKPRVRSTSP